MKDLIQTLTLRRAVLMFVLLAAGCAALIGAVSFRQTQASVVLTDELLAGVKLARAAGTLDMMHDALRGDTLAAQLAGPNADAQERDAVQRDVAQNRRTIEASLADVEAAAQNDALRAAVAEAKPVVKQYAMAAEALVQAALTGTEQAQTLRPAFEKEFDRLEERLEALSGLIEQGAEAAVAQRDTHFSQAKLSMGVLLAAALLVLSLFGMGFVRWLCGHVGAARDAARRIAGGNLAGDVPRAAHDEVGEMLDAMREMQQALSRVVGDVRRNAESVASASEQIAQGNQDLANRTAGQASALQQTAATMESLSTTIRANAGSAQQVNTLAQGASSVAQQGGQVVGQFVQTMQGISDSSRQIAEIIGTIDGIAFQTNILALNAAVEAARAGEQGRGFAVVASEVRSLAQRSAEAARQIKALINASVERVDQGSALVGEAGQTMQAVVDSIKRVTDLVGDISQASLAQSTGVSQVGAAVTQMDQATQQNAALVEESAAAADSLKTQAVALVQAVSVFQLAPDQQVGGRAPQPRAR